MINHKLKEFEGIAHAVPVWIVLADSNHEVLYFHLLVVDKTLG